VPAVLAMTAPVTDLYATDLLSRLYGELAGRAVVDPLAALADARQALETARASLPAADRHARLAEWATPALFQRGPALPLYDPTAKFTRIGEPSGPRIATGIATRRIAEFVGRRAELRTLLRVLRGTQASVVIHGIGGVGKSTLASQLVTELADQAGLMVSLTGSVAVDQILNAIASRLHHWCRTQNLDDADVRRQLIGELRSGQTPWPDRLDLLAEDLLPTVSVTLLLDNTEDNLTHDGPAGVIRFADDQLGAFLTAWTALPGAKLLATSRYPLPVSSAAARRLTSHHLGPLTLADARKLLWRLPALDALTPAEQSRAIADVGGHPRALEYLDALLSGGHASFDDVAAKIENSLRVRGIENPAAWYADIDGDLDRALAQTITLAVDDVLLGDLLARLDSQPLARRLLTGAAVYRLPVDQIGLAWQISEPTIDEPDLQQSALPATIIQKISESWVQDVNHLAEVGLTADEQAALIAYQKQRRRPPLQVPDGLAGATGSLLALGLLTPETTAGGERTFLVHRWTASAVLAVSHPNDVAAAHRHASAYWRWRVAVWPQDRLSDITQLLEAGHHILAVGDLDDLDATVMQACRQLHTWGLWDWEEHACRDVLAHVSSSSREASIFTHVLGVLAHLRGDYATAEDHYLQSLTLDEGLGDRAGIATSHHQLGLLAERRGDYETAKNHYLQSLIIVEEIGDRAGLASSHHQLGSLAGRRGEYETAKNHFFQALTFFEEIGDRAGLARSHHNLGILAQHRGDYGTAEERYRHALTLKEELGDRAGIASSLHNLGTLAELRGDYVTAEDRYRHALRLFEELGDRAGIASSHHQLGTLAERHGDYATAEERYRRTLTLFEELGDRAGIASSHHNLGNLARERGDYAAAEERYRHALTLFEELRNRAGVARIHHQFGIMAQQFGDYIAAESRYRLARTLFEEIGDRAGIASIHHNLGNLAQERGDYATAKAHLRQALSLKQQMADQAGIASTNSQMGILHTIQEQASEAVEYNLQALLIRLQIESPDALTDLRWLSRQRKALGEGQFSATLGRHLASDLVATVLEMIDQFGDVDSGTAQ
jgi:tetratricopeptide (TPR) repeat protein